MATAVSRTQVQPTRSWFQENSPATLAKPVPYTNYGGQGNPNAPTPTEQAGLANAAKNRAAAAAGVKPGPSIAVTNNRGTGVPITPMLAAPSTARPSAQAPSNGTGNIKADWQKFYQGLGQLSYSDVRTNLPRYVEQFKQQYGYNVQVNTGRPGDYDGFTLPDGSFVDVHSSTGQSIWNVEKPGGGGGGGATLKNPAGGSTADFKVNPWDQKFVAPTQQEAQNDQGFQFTLARGREALERSAAARGTLLTTGTLKDLDQFSQDAGSQQYDKVYGRRMGEYQTKYNEFTGNEGARFAAHNANFGNNLSVNQNRFTQGLLTNKNAFDQQFSLADLGFRASAQAGQAGSNYANNAGDLYTGQGNVNAAGQIGSQNAVNQGIGSLANLGQYYGQLYDWNRQQPLPSRQTVPNYGYMPSGY